VSLDSLYEADGHIPPGGIGIVSVYSRWFQTRIRRGHDADGLHNDETVPHAGAICTLTAGGCTVVKQAGFDLASPPVRIGVGQVRIKTLKSFSWWRPMVYPMDLGSLDPYYGYEARDAGAIAKTANTVDIKIVGVGGAVADVNFMVLVYGVRT
jgi:hypothetical protein